MNGDLERELRALGDRARGEVAAPAMRGGVATRGRRRRTARAVGSLGLVAALALGGIATVRALGRSAERVDGAVLAAAAEATELQQYARLRLTMQVESSFGSRSQTLDSTAEGEIDLVANRWRMSVELSGDRESSSIEMISDGSDFYSRGLEGYGDKWVKNANGSAGLGDFGSGTPGDAGGILDYLRSVSGPAERLGTDEIDGVAVTHYRAEVDPETIEPFLDEAKAATDAQPNIGDLGIEFDLEPIEVWIDTQGLVRRLDIRLSASGSSAFAGDFGFRTEMSMELFDFGADVQIRLPQPDEIVAAEDAEATPAPAQSSSPSGAGQELYMVVGQEGDSGVHLFVSKPGSKGSSLCVFGAGSWVDLVEVVDRENQKVVSVISEFGGGGSPRLGCALSGLDRATNRRLVDSPADFAIHLRGSDGRSEVVRLTNTRRP